MKRKRPILVPNSGTFGIAGKKKFYGLNRCLPHSCLVDGKISNIIGLRSSTGVGFKESVNYFLTGLKRSGCVKWKVSTII